MGVDLPGSVAALRYVRMATRRATVTTACDTMGRKKPGQVHNCVNGVGMALRERKRRIGGHSLEQAGA